MSTDSGAESSTAAAAEVERRPLMRSAGTWVGADPVPAGVALFAFALAVYGVRFVDVTDTTLVAGPVTIGLNYAVLAGAIGESVFGILALMKGLSYPGYVLSIFGVWLLGFYFLITAGAASKEFTPDALAWYAFLLIVPVVLMAVPAFAHRNIPFAIAFAAIIVLLFFLGLGYHDVYNAINTATAAKTAPKLSAPVSLLKVSAYAGFVASAALFWVFAVDVYQATGMLPPRRGFRRGFRY
jgi:hypothetical protein